MKKKEEGVLKLGQSAALVGEPIWLFLTSHASQYVVWSEADDEEYRQVLEIAPEKGLPQVLVARFNNPARAEFVRKGLRKYAKIGGDIPEAFREKVVRESVATHVLKDWRAIALPDGTTGDYTPELGDKAFKQDPDFFDAIIGAAMREEFHRAKAVKEDAELLGKS